MSLDRALQPAIERSLRLLEQSHVSGKPASSAAVIVSRCAAASKEAGTVIVMS